MYCFKFKDFIISSLRKTWSKTMMITSVGECLCASMCGETLQQTIFEWERPPAQSIHIVVNSGKGPNGNQIQGDFRNGDDDHDDEGDDGDDDCHHNKNGDGVHP